MTWTYFELSMSWDGKWFLNCANMKNSRSCISMAKPQVIFQCNNWVVRGILQVTFTWEIFLNPSNQVYYWSWKIWELAFSSFAWFTQVIFQYYVSGAPWVCMHGITNSFLSLALFNLIGSTEISIFSYFNQIIPPCHDLSHGRASSHLSCLSFLHSCLSSPRDWLPYLTWPYHLTQEILTGFSIPSIFLWSLSPSLYYLSFSCVNPTSISKPCLLAPYT